MVFSYSRIVDPLHFWSVHSIPISNRSWPCEWQPRRLLYTFLPTIDGKYCTSIFGKPCILGTIMSLFRWMDSSLLDVFSKLRHHCRENVCKYDGSLKQFLSIFERLKFLRRILRHISVSTARSSHREGFPICPLRPHRE